MTAAGADAQEKLPTLAESRQRVAGEAADGPHRRRRGFLP